VRLHLASRRVPAALAAVAACALALRIALHWPWDTYGALQLPLVFEACSAAVIAVTAAASAGKGGGSPATGSCSPAHPASP